MPPGEIHIPREATLVVAASDSLTPSADYLCNGVADEVEIQAAIDALPAVGGTVQLLEGTYHIAATINMPNLYITLKGSGLGTMLRAVNNLDSTIVHITERYCVIENLTIHGNKDNQASGIGIALDFAGSQQSTVRACFVHGCKDIGIKEGGVGGTGTMDNDIINCIIADCETGIYLGNYGGWLISDTCIRRSLTYGINIVEDNWAQIVNCRITGPGDVSLGHGVRIYGSMNVLLSATDIDGQGGHGVFVDCDSGSTDIKIVGCMIRETSKFAANTYSNIYIGGSEGASRIIIADNDLTNPGDVAKYSIEIPPPQRYSSVIIQGNLLSSWDIAGLYNYPISTFDTCKVYESHSDIFMDVLAVTANHVVNNENLAAALGIVFTIVAQPDVPRTLSGHFDSNVNITAYNMYITGYNAQGAYITEYKTQADGWDWETDNAFAVVLKIEMFERTGTGVGDTMDIGITDVLGLSNVIYETGDVYKIKKNAADAAVAAGQVSVDYSTYDMALIGLAATDDFTIWFKSNLNIIV